MKSNDYCLPIYRFYDMMCGDKFAGGKSLWQDILNGIISKEKKKKNKNGGNYVSNPDRPDKGIQETLNLSVPLHDARSHV